MILVKTRTIGKGGGTLAERASVSAFWCVDQRRFSSDMQRDGEAGAVSSADPSRLLENLRFADD